MANPINEPAGDRLARLKQKEAALRKRLLQSALLAVTALIAVCAVGIAWFVNNSRVTGSGVQVQTSGPPFELASVGSTPVPTESGATSGESYTTNNVIYSATTGAKTLVTWLVDANSNLRNHAPATGLQPGTNGKLTFYVIPKQENLGAVNCSFEVIPYGDAAAGATETITINDKRYAPLPTESRASALLQGHLLFFAGYNASNNTYATRLTADTPFKSTDLDATQGEMKTTDPVPFTIYWIWPEQFKQYADTGTNHLFAAPGEAGSDYNKLIADINANKGKYFADDTPSYAVPNTVPEVSHGMSSYNLDQCSSFYNNADQCLGSTVKYLMLRLSVTEGGA